MAKTSTLNTAVIAAMAFVSGSGRRYRTIGTIDLADGCERGASIMPLIGH